MGVAFAVRANTIVIGPQEGLRLARENRVYDIRDLFPNFERSGKAEAKRAAAAAAAAADADADADVLNEAPVPLANGGDEDAERTLEDDFVCGWQPPAAIQLGNDVTRIITDTIDPDSWRINGGNVGSIEQLTGPFAGLLVVDQTPENHEKIAQFLDDTRALLDEHLDVRLRLPDDAPLPSGRPD